LVNAKLAALAAVVLLVGALFVLIQTSSGGSGTGGGDSATNCPTGPHQFAENETALGAFQCAQVTLSMVGGSSACSSGPPQQYAISIGTITDGALVCATPVTGFTQGSDTTRTGLLTFLNTTSIGVFLHGNNAEFEILAVPWSTITNFPAGCAAGPPQSFIDTLGTTPTCAVPINPTGFDAGSKTCTDVTLTTVKMMGFKLNYTTSVASTGILYVTMNFELQVAASSGVQTSSYTLTYGTSGAPACNAGAAGTKVGNTFKWFQNAFSEISNFAPSDTVVITGLSASTAYWFDVQVSDSSTLGWTYSLPQLSVIEA